MEDSIKLLDFETVDQMVQIHGQHKLEPEASHSYSLSLDLMADYEGVSFFSRDANQKAAASEATSLFQAYYPEFLVRFIAVSSRFY